MGQVIDFQKAKNNLHWKRDVERLLYEDEVFTESEMLAIIYQFLEREGLTTERDSNFVYRS